MDFGYRLYEESCGLIMAGLIWGMFVTWKLGQTCRGVWQTLREKAGDLLNFSLLLGACGLAVLIDGYKHLCRHTQDKVP